ncbi:MAG TPA: four helix bundle protein [bacterium]|nr:four helix bundle protein [bacterium]
MEEKRYLQLSDLESYRIAFGLSNYVWDIVVKWDHFSKETVGKQFVRAVDSNSANIAEGFGRYTKKDKVNFYRYSYGSIKESLDWNEKAGIRGLISKKDYEHIYGELQKLPKALHQLIKYADEKLENNNLTILLQHIAIIN